MDDLKEQEMQEEGENRHKDIMSGWNPPYWTEEEHREYITKHSKKDIQY